MTNRRQAPRGASRSPRPNGGNKARAGASRTAPARNKSSAGQGIRKGRLALALLLILALAALIWFVKHRPAHAVATVPPALAEEPAGPASEPVDEPGQDSAGQNPERFEFYDILPNQKVLPTRQIDNKPPRAGSAGQATRPAAMETRWLQAGAFTSATEADRRRAQIRLLGLPARVQEGRDSQGRHLHRVLAGPFNSDSSLDGARRALVAAGLDAIPLSTPPDSPAGAPSP